jgi:hypothetical protein
MIRLPRLAARSVEIGELLDTFLVCAVTMVLIIRLQLFLTTIRSLGAVACTSPTYSGAGC